MKSYKPIILHLVSISWSGSYDYTHNIHQNLVNNGYDSFISIAGRRIITPTDSSIPIICEKPSLKERLKRKVHRFVMNCLKPNIDIRYAGMNLTERITEHNPQDLLNAMPVTPDVIMVHWVSGYANAKYVNDLQKATGAKVYYIMIDEAILSGCCHYPWDCIGYMNGCKNCKITNSRILKHLIRKNYKFKERYLVQEKNVIYPTTFDYIRLMKSPLWRGANTYKLIESIDESLFCPTNDCLSLRKKFEIPEGKRVVMFGCSHLNEPRKGISLLISALKIINRNDIIFFAVGNDTIPELDKQVIYTGHVDMATLAQTYQIADLFVCSSLEDSGPQMINMSIMSGTPVVAFEMGVALDIVHHGKSGYLAKLYEIDDLVKGINEILDLSDAEYKQMCQYCRDLALSTFSYDKQTEFFNNLLNNI